MPKVTYSVDPVGDVWMVGLNGKQFGPYSCLDVALTAAAQAARKAEDQGYEAEVVVNSAPEEADAPVAEAPVAEAPFAEAETEAERDAA